MKIWILIPAYNESIKIGKLLDELKEKHLSILVVDDGSTDKTYSIAQSKADIVLRNEMNSGKGLAIKKGIALLLQKNDWDYVITMDADNQHSPFDLDSFLQEANAHQAFVIGNRMINPHDMPFLRLVTNRIMSWVISRIAGQYIPDSQCGFRLISRDVLKRVDIKTDKFEIESEILIKAAQNNFYVKSIPIHSIYFKSHSSKIHPLFDTIRFIKFIAGLKQWKKIFLFR